MKKTHHLKGRTGNKANHWKGGNSRSYSKKKYCEIAEKALGKPLPKTAVVHHLDGNFTNNNKKNLVICENNGYHLLLHARERALRACGYPGWLKCCYCKKYDKPKNLYIRPDRYSGVHRSCENNYQKLRANTNATQ